jgi:hypothetical protein
MAKKPSSKNTQGTPPSPYELWLNSKLEWLARANPEYSEKILRGESNPPDKWSFRAWQRIQEKEWGEWMKIESNNPNAPF